MDLHVQEIGEHQDMKHTAFTETEGAIYSLRHKWIINLAYRLGAILC